MDAKQPGPVELGNAWEMLVRVAILFLAVGCVGFATPALATPRCTKTCRRETAGCERTRCATLRGAARQDCLETCRGIGGCTRIGTLAYVVSTCTASAFHQTLQIRHGDCDPITLLDFPEPLENPPPCKAIGDARIGVASSAIFGAFHRIGVSLDGRHVVFEVTDDFTIVRRRSIWCRRSNRRGSSSSAPTAGNCAGSARPVAIRTSGSVWIQPPPGTSGPAAPPGFCFSPDGREVVLTDLGPGPGGEDAVQIFTLDLVTGHRSEPLTQLPLVADHPVGANVLYPGTGFPCFVPDGRITFQSFGNPDGTNPDGSLATFIMNRDGSDLKRVPLPVEILGSQVVPIFGIAGASVGRNTQVLAVRWHAGERQRR